MTNDYTEYSYIVTLIAWFFLTNTMHFFEYTIIYIYSNNYHVLCVFCNIFFMICEIINSKNRVKCEMIQWLLRYLDYFGYCSQIKGRLSIWLWESGNSYVFKNVDSFINSYFIYSNKAIVIIFPSTLKGLEKKFQMLFEHTSPVNDTLIEIIAKEGPNISFNLR
jgi:hypothetical protein